MPDLDVIDPGQRQVTPPTSRVSRRSGAPGVETVNFRPDVGALNSAMSVAALPSTKSLHRRVQERDRCPAAQEGDVVAGAPGTVSSPRLPWMTCRRHRLIGQADLVGRQESSRHVVAGAGVATVSRSSCRRICGDRHVAASHVNTSRRRRCVAMVDDVVAGGPGDPKTHGRARRRRRACFVPARSIATWVTTEAGRVGDHDCVGTASGCDVDVSTLLRLC